MSTNKGEIIYNEKVDIPHPRDKKSKLFRDYSYELEDLFLEASRREHMMEGRLEDDQ